MVKPTQKESDFNKLLIEVELMRSLQKEYFDKRSQDILKRSKESEKQVDTLIRAIRQKYKKIEVLPEPKQNNLF